MSRPAKHPGTHRQSITLTMDPQFIARMKDFFAGSGFSISQVAEDLLREWIKETEEEIRQTNHELSKP